MKLEDVVSWLVLGDSNEILSHSEKKGGQIRLEWQLEYFREVLTNCDLRDLKFLGAPFMWINQRVENDLICETLDRCVSNTEWCNLFSRSSAIHGFVAYLDHISLLMQTDGGLKPECEDTNPSDSSLCNWKIKVQ